MAQFFPQFWSFLALEWPPTIGVGCGGGSGSRRGGIVIAIVNIIGDDRAIKSINRGAAAAAGIIIRKCGCEERASALQGVLAFLVSSSHINHTLPAL